MKLQMRRRRKRVEIENENKKYEQIVDSSYRERERDLSRRQNWRLKNTFLRLARHH